MVQFILAILLLLPLSAKPDKVLIDQLQKIYPRMLDNFASTIIRRLNDCTEDGDDVIEDAPLQDFLRQIPLWQPLKAKSYHDDQSDYNLLLRYLEDFEVSRLFDLMYASVPKVKCDGTTTIPKDFDATRIAQDFLQGLDFIYTPLIKAHQEGLEIKPYWQALQESQKNMAWKSTDKLAHQLKPSKATSALIQENPTDPNIPLIKHFFKIAKVAYASYLFADSKRQSKEDITSHYSESYDLYIRKFVVYYQARINAFLGGSVDGGQSVMQAYFDTLSHTHSNPSMTTKEAMAIFIPKNPSVCFNPQFLNQEAKEVCLHTFQNQTYARKPLKEYLRTLRLISIGTAPCLYLKGKRTITRFKSQDSLCLALQKLPLEKEF
ncbi:hypothetical protein ACFOPX_01770 [Helicobacter baculiformis]|uniref:Uncharacterized protein n=1 Tax=Helicobacter baculiformis TaxID=427351 RepID=A0ABV7ZFD6_9HELI|nr:hypothetical protein [Helicobacter baculiformis]